MTMLNYNSIFKGFLQVMAWSMDFAIFLEATLTSMDMLDMFIPGLLQMKTILKEEIFSLKLTTLV